MKRGRLTSGIIAITVSGVLGLTITAVASASPGTPAPNRPTAARQQTIAKQQATAKPQATAKQNVVVLNCLGKPQVKPSSFVLACADGNSSLSALAWTSWTPKLASAAGTLVQNDCIPYCAAGHFHSYPALVVFWGSVGYASGHRYNEFTLIFPGARPQIFNGHKWVQGPQTLTGALWGPPPSRAQLN